jgi:hypothetical protein
MNELRSFDLGPCCVVREREREREREIERGVRNEEGAAQRDGGREDDLTAASIGGSVLH